MNIQIYGSKKSFDTKKAERYFKERKIKYQYIDLHQFGMAKAVFEAAKKCIPVEDMIDRKAKAYTRLYMDYIDEAKREQTLFENPELFYPFLSPDTFLPGIFQEFLYLGFHV